MEFLNFTFAFSTPRFCMNDTDTEFCKGKPDLLCDILGSVIKVTGIKSSVTQDRLVKGILDDRFLLIIIESGEQEPSGMVINSRGQIGLYFGTIFSNRKFGSILDISLDQHHAVRFAEAFR